MDANSDGYNLPNGHLVGGYDDQSYPAYDAYMHTHSTSNDPSQYFDVPERGYVLDEEEEDGVQDGIVYSEDGKLKKKLI